MNLYYYEILGDKYLCASDYMTADICHLFGNAKFFGSKKSAKMWYGKFEDLYPEAILYKLEAINFTRAA